MASNFVLLDNFPSVPYQPLDYVFPKRFYSGKPQQCHSSWFKSWSWLHYDTTKDAAYCHTCVANWFIAEEDKLKYITTLLYLQLVILSIYN